MRRPDDFTGTCRSVRRRTSDQERRDDDAELRGYWAKLSDGATIGEELALAPWGDTFGMLTDRFGTRWMVSIASAPAQ